jgi:mono/diheme cytochrome c family protein/glucose/arabinose dehydrogenase
MLRKILLPGILAMLVIPNVSLVLGAGKATGTPTQPAESANEPAKKDDGGLSSKDLNLPPPLGPLAVEDAIKSFVLPPGFKIECVASEPLVEDPVAVQWDGDGRMWVVEMRGFMPDAYGHHEDEPIGRISILEDTTGSGHYDKKTVFLDNLVMPRTVSLVGDGVLIGVPPKLIYCRSSKHDDHCDQQTVIIPDYAATGNVEHQANGNVWMIDNWLYNAKSATRLHYEGHGKFTTDITAFRGQWGICQDDYGRLFYNYNEDGLRGDLIPSEYLERNPHYHSPSGVNVQISKDQSVYPARKNLTNRSYRLSEVGPNGKLRKYTSACAPMVYRADLLPKEYYGSVFIAEPAGELIRRDVLDEEDGTVNGHSVHGDTDFLASTDERSRPVSLYTGPEGAIYFVDMYHGIIQHNTYVTPFLRRQSIERGLDKGLHFGRIYRIVPDDFKQPPQPHFQNAPDSQLVELLSDSNGWKRDTAQRLLVERGLDQADQAAIKPLKTLLTKGDNPLGRLHAMWTLDGLKALDQKSVLAALKDHDPHVRAAALRHCDALLRGKTAADILPNVMALGDDTDPAVRLQFALTAGPFTAFDDALVKILESDGANPYIRDAIITGLGGREEFILQRLLADAGFNADKPGRAAVVSALSQCIFADAKRREQIRWLLDVVTKQSTGSWQQVALLEGIINPKQSKGAPPLKPVRLDGEPPSLAAILKLDDPKLKPRLQKLDHLIVWEGKLGVVLPPPPPPLSPEQLALFQSGKVLYQTTCGACHQPTGLGHEGLAPPLVGSDWVDGPPQRIVRIVLNGVDGGIKVNGATFNLEMPPLKVLNDEQIASLITYVRREWDHEASPVTVDLVKTIRKSIEGRENPFTMKELLEVKD